MRRADHVEASASILGANLRSASTWAAGPNYIWAPLWGRYEIFIAQAEGVRKGNPAQNHGIGRFALTPARMPIRYISTLHAGTRIWRVIHTASTPRQFQKAWRSSPRPDRVRLAANRGEMRDV